MAWPLIALAVFSAAVSVIGGIQASQNAERAAEAQEREAELQARQIEAEGYEQARRDKLANREINSENLKRAAASGVQVSGSVEDHLTKVKKEQQKELDWLGRSTANRADLTRQSGANAAAVTEASGQAQLWGAAASAAGSAAAGYDAYQNP